MTKKGVNRLVEATGCDAVMFSDKIGTPAIATSKNYFTLIEFLNPNFNDLRLSRERFKFVVPGKRYLDVIGFIRESPPLIELANRISGSSTTFWNHGYDRLQSEGCYSAISCSSKTGTHVFNMWFLDSTNEIFAVSLFNVIYSKIDIEKHAKFLTEKDIINLNSAFNFELLKY